jgi:hypothetical protein
MQLMYKAISKRGITIPTCCVRVHKLPTYKKMVRYTHAAITIFIMFLKTLLD